MADNKDAQKPGSEIALTAQVTAGKELQSFATNQINTDDMVNLRIVLENTKLETALTHQMAAFHAAEKAKNEAEKKEADELAGAPLGDLEAKAQAVIDALAALNMRCSVSYSRGTVREKDGTYKAAVSFSFKDSEANVVLPIPQSLKDAMDDAKLKVQALRDATNQVAATRSRIQNSSKRKEMAKAKITAATLSRLEGGAEMLDAITREIDSDLAHMITPAHLEAGGLPPIDVQVDEPKSKKSSE